MSHKNKDPLGDRMKLYESQEAGRRFIPLLPICIRLDGRSFSRWTKGLGRPYDARLHDLMTAVTRGLVEETNACVGYTQSDEISLVLYSADLKSQVYFDGRIQKIVSSLSGFASALFNAMLGDYIPEKCNTGNLATFDCRAWTVPNLDEAVNTVLWREFDATKNSVSQSAHFYYSHNQLLGKHKSEMQDMLMAKGVNWNDYPDWFKRGTYVQRRLVSRPYSTAEIERLPARHEARTNPGLVDRHVVQDGTMPPLARVVNRVAVVFHGEAPVVAEKEA